jgi:hypothetical protein
VGKRYGSLGLNGLSITHNEYRIARDQRVPSIFLVDQEVLSYKKLFDANEDGVPIPVPGMDSPQEVFSFCREIMDSPINNGILPFSNLSEARLHVKRQLAHLFGDLLTVRFDPVRSGMNDILSEIKVLRHELNDEHSKDSVRFLKTVQFLLEGTNSLYKTLAESLCGTIDNAAPHLLTSLTFEDFVIAATGQGMKVREFSQEELTGAIDVVFGPEYRHQSAVEFFCFRNPLTDEKALIIWGHDPKTEALQISPSAAEVLKSLHRELRKAIA